MGFRFGRGAEELFKGGVNFPEGGLGSVGKGCPSSVWESPLALGNEAVLQVRARGMGLLQYVSHGNLPAAATALLLSTDL